MHKVTRLTILSNALWVVSLSRRGAEPGQAAGSGDRQGMRVSGEERFPGGFSGRHRAQEATLGMQGP